MKKNIYLAIAFIAALITSSCDKQNNDYVITQNIPGCFANVIDNANGNSELVSSMTVGISINYTQNNSEVVINGLKLPDGSSYSAMKLNGLSFDTKDGWLIVSGANVEGDTGNYSQTVTITNFKLQILDRTINSEYLPALAVSFTVNEKYTVYATRIVQYLAGTTRCGNFTTKATYYGFGLDASKKILEIAMQNAQFMEGMPKMNFNLKNISFTMNQNIINFSADALIPNIGNTPNDAYPISKLSGTIDPINGFTLKFDCAPRALNGATFTVDASGNFFDIPVADE